MLKKTKRIVINVFKVLVILVLLLTFSLSLYPLFYYPASVIFLFDQYLQGIITWGTLAWDILGYTLAAIICIVSVVGIYRLVKSLRSKSQEPDAIASDA